MKTWMQNKRKTRFTTSQHLTNSFAFDIENTPTSFNLGCTKWVWAFCFLSLCLSLSLSPYFLDKCWENCEERPARKMCWNNMKQHSVLLLNLCFRCKSLLHFQNTWWILIFSDHFKFTISKRTTALSVLGFYFCSVSS